MKIMDFLPIANYLASPLFYYSYFNFTLFLHPIVNENVSLVISRQLLSDVASQLVKIDDSVSKVVSHYTLEVVQPRVISFEDQVGAIRQHLADIYEREQNWRQAAQACVLRNQ